jgi:hypothetical protein
MLLLICMMIISRRMSKCVTERPRTVQKCNKLVCQQHVAALYMATGWHVAAAPVNTSSLCEATHLPCIIKQCRETGIVHTLQAAALKAGSNYNTTYRRAARSERRAYIVASYATPQCGHARIICCCSAAKAFCHGASPRTQVGCGMVPRRAPQGTAPKRNHKQ